MSDAFHVFPTPSFVNTRRLETGYDHHIYGTAMHEEIEISFPASATAGFDYSFDRLLRARAGER